MLPRIIAVCFTAFSLGLLSAPLHADVLPGEAHPIAPFGEILPRVIDSGPRANDGRDAAIVHSELVATLGAQWKRLYFSEVTLEAGSRIRFTSLLDGAIQELDAAGIAVWSNTSAYFNGSMVLIELIAAPGTRTNRFVLEEVGVEINDPASGHCSPPLACGLCNGEDNREPSNENWACRLVSGGGGCSAAIWNEQSCVVSAGHCMGSNMVIQFNVPQSNPNCSINHPPPADQFPITGHISQNAGVGADWAVMTSGQNDLGQTAFERFGEYRPIASSVPSSGPADVWGYGVTDDCIFRQTQQHSTGEIVDLASAAVYHSAETTCGNSGSSLLQNGQIIGIVSHCTFNCPPNGNTATRIDLPAFMAARDELCGIPVDVTVPGDYPTIQAAINDVSGGSSITVAPGTFPEAIRFFGKNITVIASGGPEVTIIDATGLSASVARFSNGESANAVLDGFTLTGGTGSSVSIGGTGYLLGGGIYAAGSAPTIRNCIIISNTAQFGGGMFNNNASPTVENCTFEANTSSPSSGGGVFNFSGATPQFINTVFIGNTATVNGGAMSNQASHPIVTNCHFEANHALSNGGAVRNIQSSAGQFMNSSFKNNTAGGNGGAFFNDDSPATTVADSEFCGNSPNHTAGAYTNGGGNTFEGECSIPGDLTGNGSVGVEDLLILLAAWGPCADCTPGHCPADLDGDCNVGVSDLLILLANWG